MAQSTSLGQIWEVESAPESIILDSQVRPANDSVVEEPAKLLRQPV